MEKTGILLLLFFLLCPIWSCDSPFEEPGYVTRHYALIPSAEDSLGMLAGLRSPVGKIEIELEQGDDYFKVKVYLDAAMPSQSYQLFIKGESNYKMMEYGKTYFCGSRFENAEALILRIILNGDRYMSLELEETGSVEPDTHRTIHTSLGWEPKPMAGIY